MPDQVRHDGAKLHDFANCDIASEGRGLDCPVRGVHPNDTAAAWPDSGFQAED
jgi:hypothetical protein